MISHPFILFVLSFINIAAAVWFVPLCLLVGLAYAAILYLNERRFEFSVRRRTLMAAIRTLVVSVIAFFLLSPFMRSATDSVSKPIIIVAQDNSASIVANKDSVFYKTEYPEMINKLVFRLKKKFDVHTFSFGQKISNDITYSFDEMQTNISDFISEVHARYANRNVGALIVASDGIYNQGIHPKYSVKQLPYPLFAVALGDTMVQRDALIVKVIHNRIAYLGNSFPIEIHVRSLLCNGLSARLEVGHKGRTVYAENIAYQGEHFNKIVPVVLQATEAGLQRFTVTLQPVGGEISKANNVKDIFVEVFEGKQKVLLLYSSPHPDVAALKQSIESHQNYELAVNEISQLQENAASFNLVILHQLPTANANISQLLQQLRDQQIPTLFIVGSTTSTDLFNTLQTGLAINATPNQINEALPSLNQSFGLFTLSQELRELSKNLPPLYSPAGLYKVTGAVSVLFYQHIGNLVTEMPLIIATDFSGYKIGIIAGEGIWRWRLANFSRTNNHQVFDEMIGKLIQYLSLREEKSRFRVSTKNTWNESEDIEFVAEFYNSTYEPVNENEVELSLSDDEDRTFPFVFSPIGNSYILRVGRLQPGNYIYNARTVSQQEVFTTRGAFSVLPLQSELVSTTADHQLMYGLARHFGGEMLYPSTIENVATAIEARDDIKPLIYRELKFREMIDITWLFLLIAALLAVEWILRRSAGGY